MNKTTDSFKRLQAVIKDVNGDNRQIIKSLQDQIDYLMEFIAVQGEVIEKETGCKKYNNSKQKSFQDNHKSAHCLLFSFAVLIDFINMTLIWEQTLSNS